MVTSWQVYCFYLFDVKIQDENILRLFTLRCMICGIKNPIKQYNKTALRLSRHACSTSASYHNLSGNVGTRSLRTPERAAGNSHDTCINTDSLRIHVWCSCRSWLPLTGFPFPQISNRPNSSLNGKPFPVFPASSVLSLVLYPSLSLSSR